MKKKKNLWYRNNITLIIMIKIILIKSTTDIIWTVVGSVVGLCVLLWIWGKCCSEPYIEGVKK